MRVTNNLNLPGAFVNAVNRERHNEPGSYSATTLNKGVKEILLTDRHWDEITVDAADSVWVVWGTAVHALMESQKDDNFHEERFKVRVENSWITGQVDSYDMQNHVIYDWKTASIWKVQFKDFTDWKKQGLTYAWLMKQSGFEVSRCVFVALLKDHSKTKAKTDKEYPQSPVFTYQFDVTEADLAETEARIKDKIRQIEQAQEASDDEIPPCSPEERWADADKWAVMKNGRKTALKLFDSEVDAENFAGEQGNSCYVEYRPATSRKCADYCPCCEFCSYYRNEVSK